ncbi:GDSL family lipase [Sporocytophaga myxococcoides]|uniref:GDSL family lipase n=1 Tax=Sporocytophaga myxococcoides TaxID=153721 RepID=A0A098LDZ1_9BACT|nr:SGNH/GDSL hydrolase family protein [Sporocytophaga myxococcoides]GAL84669.1 GDSL family lipase [Sporocytophaga myxococcoides]
MYQGIYLFGCLLGIPLLPVIIIQGKILKRKIPVLPEAEKNRVGFIGNGDAINLVTIGESTVAGVGVDDHEQGLTGNIAKALQEFTGKKINWDVFANSGYSADAVNKKLIPLLPSKPIDLIIIGLGANDAFELKSPVQWKKGITDIIVSIRNRNINCPIVIAAMPPLRYCPVFSILFRCIFGGLVFLYSKTMKGICRNNQEVYFINQEINYKNWSPRIDPGLTVNDLFCDGVHPSKLSYELWGKEIGEYVLKNKLI